MTTTEATPTKEKAEKGKEEKTKAKVTIQRR